MPYIASTYDRLAAVGITVSRDPLRSSHCPDLEFHMSNSTNMQASQIAAELESISGQGGPGTVPWSAGQGARPPKLKSFKSL